MQPPPRSPARAEVHTLRELLCGFYPPDEYAISVSKIHRVMRIFASPLVDNSEQTDPLTHSLSVRAEIPAGAAAPLALLARLAVSNR